MTRLPTLPLFLLLTGCAGLATDEDVQNADADLSDAIAALEQRVTDAEVRVASTEERLADAEAELLALGQSMNEADAALDERVTTLESTTTDLGDRVGALEDHATEVDGRLDTLDADVADLDVGLADLDAATATSLNDLNTRVSANETDLSDAVGAIAEAEVAIASLEGAMVVEVDRVDGELAELSDAVAQLQDALVFLGANDASFSIDIGNSVDAASSAIDDSAGASHGSVLAGSGTMEATGFQVPDLDDGLYEVSLSFAWGAGLAVESITQRFTLECSGSTVLYNPRTTISAGDADSQGINVAHRVTVSAWVEASAGDTLDCELHKRITALAYGGDGVLYNDVTAPFIARVELEQPE